MTYTPSDPYVVALIRLCEKEGGYKKVAEKTGLNKDHLWQIVAGITQPSGNPRGVGPKSRSALASAYPDWFTVGGAPMTANASNVGEAPTDEDFSLVQQLDIAASCGTGYFVDHVVVKGGLAFKKSSLREFGVSEKSARIIYANGGSMEPSIQDGCVVLINLADIEPREGKIYAICQPDGSMVLKRLVYDYIPAISAQGWVMRSDNPNKTLYPDKMLPPDNRTSIVGRAVWNDNRL